MISLKYHLGLNGLYFLSVVLSMARFQVKYKIVRRFIEIQYGDDLALQANDFELKDVRK